MDNFVDNDSRFNSETGAWVLQTNSLANIPKNAVIVSKEEAVKYRLSQIYNWTPKSDVWSVHYGPWILGFSSLIPSVAITQYFRRKLKLRGRGYFLMYTGITYVPFLLTSALQYEFVTKSIAEMDMKTCPICLEMKSALIQCLMSTVYPVCLAGPLGLMFAARHGTYDLPYHKDYVGMAKQLFKLSQPLWRQILLYCALGTFVSNAITYVQIQQIYKISENVSKSKLKDLEENLNIY